MHLRFVTAVLYLVLEHDSELSEYVCMMGVMPMITQVMQVIYQHLDCSSNGS